MTFQYNNFEFVNFCFIHCILEVMSDFFSDMGKNLDFLCHVLHTTETTQRIATRSRINKKYPIKYKINLYSVFKTNGLKFGRLVCTKKKNLNK